MQRCKKCGVPLEGVLGKIAKVLFRIRPSTADPTVCIKCQDSPSVYKPHIKGPHHPAGKYRCQLCDRDIDETAALVHVKSEEYLIELIKKDHPGWAKDKNTCRECLDYYRRLVKEGEI
jgi:hypothetical protein